MLGTYTYHQIIRKTVIAFGTLFNNIEIRKFDKDSNVESIKKVLPESPLLASEPRCP